MADQYIRRNRLAYKIEKCECQAQALMYLLEVLGRINDNNLGKLTEFKCKTPNEVIIYHESNFDINMIMILYENGDIEYNSVIGSDYFLKNDMPEQRMKTVLEKFLQGDYKFQNLYYSGQLIESNLVLNCKIIKTKKMSFFNKIRKIIFPNRFTLEEELGMNFY